MAEKKQLRIQKKSLLALYELDKRGIEPIDYLLEVYREAMQAYQSGRGYTDKGDAGPAYLANALNAAKTLASYKYPTLSAMAIKDITELDKAEASKPMTTKEAIKIMQADPFAPPAIKAMNAEELNPEIGPLPIGKHLLDK
jgi:hypothetical protein